jgi:hypothetical protein
MSGDDAQTALYRLFGDDDALLYIGIARYFGRRWHQHALAQPWWPEVKRQTVDWHPSREEALRAEAAAIRTEFPRHNVVHNGPRPEQAAPPVVLAPPLPAAPHGLPVISDQAMADHLGITLGELHALPTTITIREAAPLLGIGRTKATELARAGEFPCRVITMGKRTVVPVFALLQTPGVTVNVNELRALVITADAA